MIFAAVRYFLIGVLLVLNIAILVLAASVFSVADSHNLYRAIYVYIIFLSAFSCVFLLPIALIDYLRHGAIPSRVLFELGWLVLFWIMHLAAASALTAAPACTATESCNQAQHTMLIFSWLAVSVLLVHLATLLYITLANMNDVPDIWSMGVRDVIDKPATPPMQGQRPLTLQPQRQSQLPQAPAPAPQQQQNQSSGNESGAGNGGGARAPWHGRRRSREAHSWRSRYPSQSFSGSPQGQTNFAGVGAGAGGAGNGAADAGAAQYPFAGVGSGNNANDEEAMIQPLPVAFTFERSRPAAPPAAVASTSAAAGERNRTRSRGNSNPVSNANAHPFYQQNQNQQLSQPQLPSQVPRRQRRPSHPPSGPAPSGALPSVPPQQRVVSSQPRPSRRERERLARTQSEQVPPTNPLLFSPSQQQEQPVASSSRHPHSRSQSHPLPQPEASSSRRPPRAQPPAPNTNQILLISPLAPVSSAGPSPVEIDRRAHPRLLPDTTAFYATHIQSVLRPEDASPSDDAYGGADLEANAIRGGNGSSTSVVYASTPKPKVLSPAQAYAAEASRKAVGQGTRVGADPYAPSGSGTRR